MKVRACARCRSVGYCSKECQRIDYVTDRQLRRGHKFQCHPKSVTMANDTQQSKPQAPSVITGNIEDNDTTVRLEMQRPDASGQWDDVGPINLLEDVASLSLQSNRAGISNGLPTMKKQQTSAQPRHLKQLPLNTQKILSGNADTYRYRHSADGVDENLMILLHGAGDTHIPFDKLGQQMELPQTATLSVSAAMSLRLPNNAAKSSFTQLPFGLGHTWFEEMDYVSTGETLLDDNPRRLKSLKHAVECLDTLICSLVGNGSHDSNDDRNTWIPERVFFFGFSAGACLAMEFCREWFLKGRTPFGGAICVAGGIKTATTVTSNDTRQSKQPTDVLIIAGSNDAIFSKEAAYKSKKLYDTECSCSEVHVHVEHGKEHAMAGSKVEMRVVMEYLSKRLVRRMVGMAGESVAS